MAPLTVDRLSRTTTGSGCERASGSVVVAAGRSHWTGSGCRMLRRRSAGRGQIGRHEHCTGNLGSDSSLH